MEKFLRWWGLKLMKEQEKNEKVNLTNYAKMLATMNSLPIPLISIVSGNTFGGGLGLISVSDTVIATNTSNLALPKRGLD